MLFRAAYLCEYLIPAKSEHIRRKFVFHCGNHTTGLILSSLLLPCQISLWSSHMLFLPYGNGKYWLFFLMLFRAGYLCEYLIPSKSEHTMRKFVFHCGNHTTGLILSSLLLPCQISTWSSRQNSYFDDFEGSCTPLLVQKQLFLNDFERWLYTTFGSKQLILNDFEGSCTPLLVQKQLILNGFWKGAGFWERSWILRRELDSEKGPRLNAFPGSHASRFVRTSRSRFCVSRFFA